MDYIDYLYAARLYRSDDDECITFDILTHHKKSKKDPCYKYIAVDLMESEPDLDKVIQEIFKSACRLQDDKSIRIFVHYNIIQEPYFLEDCLGLIHSDSKAKKDVFDAIKRHRKEYYRGDFS